MTDIATHPVQNARKDRTGKAPQVVTMRAYEVYRHLHGEQEAMVTGWYRGGFSTGELIAFLFNVSDIFFGSANAPYSLRLSGLSSYNNSVFLILFSFIE